MVLKASIKEVYKKVKLQLPVGETVTEDRSGSRTWALQVSSWHTRLFRRESGSPVSGL